jgi:hypothetical protein
MDELLRVLIDAAEDARKIQLHPGVDAFGSDAFALLLSRQRHLSSSLHDRCNGIREPGSVSLGRDLKRSVEPLPFVLICGNHQHESIAQPPKL